MLPLTSHWKDKSRPPNTVNINIQIWFRLVHWGTDSLILLRKFRFLKWGKALYRCEFTTVLYVTLEACWGTSSWLFPHETHVLLPCWMGINMCFMFRFPMIGKWGVQLRFHNHFPSCTLIILRILVKDKQKIMDVLKRSQHFSCERIPFCNDTHLI